VTYIFQYESFITYFRMSNDSLRKWEVHGRNDQDVGIAYSQFYFSVIIKNKKIKKVKRQMKILVSHLITNQLPFLFIVILTQKLHLIWRQIHGALRREMRGSQLPEHHQVKTPACQQTHSNDCSMNVWSLQVKTKQTHKHTQYKQKVRSIILAIKII